MNTSAIESQLNEGRALINQGISAIEKMQRELELELKRMQNSGNVK